MVLGLMDPEGNVILHANPFTLKVLYIYLSQMTNPKAEAVAAKLREDGYGYNADDVGKMVGQIEVLIRSWGTTTAAQVENRIGALKTAQHRPSGQREADQARPGKKVSVN